MSVEKILKILESGSWKSELSPQYKELLIEECKSKGLTEKSIILELISRDTQLNIGGLWSACCKDLREAITDKCRAAYTNVDLTPEEAYKISRQAEIEWDSIVMKLLPTSQISLIALERNIDILLTSYSDESVREDLLKLKTLALLKLKQLKDIHTNLLNVANNKIDPEEYKKFRNFMNAFEKHDQWRKHLLDVQQKSKKSPKASASEVPFKELTLENLTLLHEKLVSKTEEQYDLIAHKRENRHKLQIFSRLFVLSLQDSILQSLRISDEERIYLKRPLFEGDINLTNHGIYKRAKRKIDLFFELNNFTKKLYQIQKIELISYCINHLTNEQLARYSEHRVVQPKFYQEIIYLVDKRFNGKDEHLNKLYQHYKYMHSLKTILCADEPMSQKIIKLFNAVKMGDSRFLSSDEAGCNLLKLCFQIMYGIPENKAYGMFKPYIKQPSLPLTPIAEPDTPNPVRF